MKSASCCLTGERRQELSAPSLFALGTLVECGLPGRDLCVVGPSHGAYDQQCNTSRRRKEEGARKWEVRVKSERARERERERERESERVETKRSRKVTGTDADDVRG